ncbi:MerR family transcriptional regulator [Flavobacterium paronense]|uniref:MerR family transcriptional regulator n=1 Tax=Flavobacterium paronense TaxID=1392775 RepID=A0ABV5GAF7_9FLAO|nr:MerR family transcriptional regulator [Flavobacterium paronense]MDN3677439.1 MerR family transcriptional regulator [Flavobacterium paronense]
MNKIKSQFSIKDLENLSGIKSHTIRIWEKRYQLFKPSRTETNIRYYSLDEFQKLLNVSFLNNYGYKISRIAKLSDLELNNLVKEVYSDKTNSVFAINILKIAMLNFDAVLFNETHNELTKTKSFSSIFIEIYIPFLSEIGMLWQTNSIKPIHEHFISNLIYQKLVENICSIQIKNKLIDSEKTFVLFLPENEAHEISLMFINYLLINKGYKTIYFGSSIPFIDLLEINKFYDNVEYVSHFTVMPTADEIDDYILNFYNKILKENSSKLHISGRQSSSLKLNVPSVFQYNSAEKLIDAL